MNKELEFVFVSTIPLTLLTMTAGMFILNTSLAFTHAGTGAAMLLLFLTAGWFALNTLTANLIGELHQSTISTYLKTTRIGYGALTAAVIAAFIILSL